MDPSNANILINPPGITPKRVRILFVDDEAPVLNILAVAMRPMAKEWDAHYAESGESALKLLDQQSFDVVVSDMRMPGINGAQLLNQVLRKHPRTVRIVLSGYSDLREAMSCVGVVHQFLQKPCNLAELRNCIRRVTALESQIHHEGLRTFAAGIDHLPSAPHLYMQMLEALESPNTSADRIADIASEDPALSAKLLHLCNSAFFGFSREVNSVEEAVQLLGVGTLQSLALAVPLFSEFDQAKCPEFPLEKMWEHSAQTGLLARWITHHQLPDGANLSDQAFAAGVLHDIGKLIIAENLPAEYSAILKQCREESISLFDAERKAFGATHADIGAYLLTLWGLPLHLVEGVAYHHEPQLFNDKEFSLVGAVHIANVLEREQSHQDEFTHCEVNMKYAQSVGITDQLEKWRLHFETNAND
jgi:HD-like signal output (HDOD) protein